jgi:hypothetical protein
MSTLIGRSVRLRPTSTYNLGASGAAAGLRAATFDPHSRLKLISLSLGLGNVASASRAFGSPAPLLLPPARGPDHLRHVDIWRQSRDDPE